MEISPKVYFCVQGWVGGNRNVHTLLKKKRIYCQSKSSFPFKNYLKDIFKTVKPINKGMKTQLVDSLQARINMD